MILRTLSAGPATRMYLYRTFFRKPGDQDKYVSRQMFERAMKKLENRGYLRRYEFSPPNLSVKNAITCYVLTEAGVNFVCNEFAMERDFVRCAIPKNSEYKHELLVSDVIRILHKEAFENKAYKIDYIYDDRMMKRQAPPRKGLFYPDLRVRIVSKLRPGITFNIEVDAGEKGRGYWLQKMRSWADTTLVLTLTEDRTNMLYEYTVKANLKTQNGFAVYYDFGLGGLMSTRFKWAPQKAMARVNI